MMLMFLLNYLYLYYSLFLLSRNWCVIGIHYFILMDHEWVNGWIVGNGFVGSLMGHG